MERRFSAHTDNGLLIGVALLGAFLIGGCATMPILADMEWSARTVTWIAVAAVLLAALWTVLWLVSHPVYALGTHALAVDLRIVRLRFPYRRIESLQQVDVLTPGRSGLSLIRRMLLPTRLMLCIAPQPLLLQLRWGMVRLVYIAPADVDGFFESVRARAPGIRIVTEPDSSGRGWQEG